MPMWFQWVVFAYFALQVVSAVPAIAHEKESRGRVIVWAFSILNFALAALTLWFIAGGGK